jgi:hypothetical protein
VAPRPQQIDSRAYHLAAADQDRTTERHDKLAAHGILTLHFPRKRIKTDAPGHRQRAPAVDHGGSAGRVSQPLWVRHKTRARPGKPRDKSPNNPGIRRKTPLMLVRADPNIQDKSNHARLINCHIRWISSG